MPPLGLILAARRITKANDPADVQTVADCIVIECLMHPQPSIRLCCIRETGHP